MLTQEQLYNVEELQLKLLEQYPMWRKGQAFFNAMYTLYPNIADSIRGTKNDCFYNDDNIDVIKKMSGDIRILINKFKTKQLELKALVKEFVNNKKIPLDFRWHWFIKSGLGDHKNYYEEFEGISSDLYYDEFYIEKYQTVEVEYLFNRGIERKFLDTQEKIDLFKEDVLSKFIKSFKFDW